MIGSWVSGSCCQLAASHWRLRCHWLLEPVMLIALISRSPSNAATAGSSKDGDESPYRKMVVNLLPRHISLFSSPMTWGLARSDNHAPLHLASQQTHDRSTTRTTLLARQREGFCLETQRVGVLRHPRCSSLLLAAPRCSSLLLAAPHITFVMLYGGTHSHNMRIARRCA
jgi:hypothetical protein